MGSTFPRFLCRAISTCKRFLHVHFLEADGAREQPAMMAARGGCLEVSLNTRITWGLRCNTEGGFGGAKRWLIIILHGKSCHFTYYEFDGSVLRPILLVAPCRGKIKHYLRQNQLQSLLSHQWTPLVPLSPQDTQHTN